MAKRLIITGASGFVGGSVLAQAAALGPDWEAATVSRSGAPEGWPGISRAIEPGDAEAWARVFDDLKPAALIHCAAIADIDFCQKNRDEARRANIEFTKTLARLCAGRGARMVFTSTDTVFDGSRGGCKEGDEPKPVNCYGETKVEAERAVAEIAPDSIVARVCLVMGLPFFGAGNSFLPRMIASLQERKRVGVPDAETRSPIDVATLGRALLELACESRERGIIHLAGNDALRRYDMARRIAARLGYDPELIFVQNPIATPGRAPRPLDVSLDNSKTRATLKTPMLGLEAGLDHCMAAANRG